MSDKPRPIAAPSHWERLRRLTPARIALGHTGVSLPTAHHLSFQMAHARAAKAVHDTLDVPALAGSLAARGWTALPLKSAVSSRTEYLTRPDLGRRLAAEALATLQTLGAPGSDVAFVIVDGLSAAAVEMHAVPLLDTALPMLEREGVSVAPIAVVENGRVAIGDEIAQALGAQVVVVLIGERPGLSSPDSLGLYLTFGAQVGCTDEARNCISNVREAGIPPQEAAEKLLWLVQQSLGRGLSGVALKDDAPVSRAVSANARTFLTGGSRE